MSNADLIEQAREAIDNMDDFARMANVVATGPLLVLNSAIDALELADKRIDELKQLVEDERENAREWKLSSSAATDKLADAERKLSVAREALIQLANAADNQGAFTGMSWQQAKAVCTAALAQIGGNE